MDGINLINVTLDVHGTWDEHQLRPTPNNILRKI